MDNRLLATEAMGGHCANTDKCAVYTDGLQQLPPLERRTRALSRLEPPGSGLGGPARGW